MNDPLRRLIIWSVTLFGLLLTVVAVVTSVRVWAARDAFGDDNAVTNAEVVSMQPYVGRTPVILVIGPTGAEVRVEGTEYVTPPYPLEGTYIEVVFIGSDFAVTPRGVQDRDAMSAKFLIVGIWLGWCLVIVGCWKGGRLLLDAVGAGWPVSRQPPRRPRKVVVEQDRLRDTVVKRDRPQDVVRSRRIEEDERPGA